MLGDGDEGWRPGGIQVTGVDDAGRLYVMMHPDGYEGSHKDPGTEVWVYDVDTQERVQRIELALPVISMGMTVGDDPYLMGTNVNLQIDVYSVATGEHLRTLSGFGEETALMVHGAY